MPWFAKQHPRAKERDEKIWYPEGMVRVEVVRRVYYSTAAITCEWRVGEPRSFNVYQFINVVQEGNFAKIRLKQETDRIVHRYALESADIIRKRVQQALEPVWDYPDLEIF